MLGLFEAFQNHLPTSIFPKNEDAPGTPFS